jgi:hypothetical protein
MIRRAHCPDTDSLVSFLYDEFDGSEAFDRRAIARHLDEGCDRCAAEVTSLGGVRSTLKEWAAPEMALGFRVVNDPPPRRSWGLSWLPAWSTPALPLAAAAMVVLGAGLGLARLDIQYDANGLRVRTGWGHAPGVTQAAATDGRNGAGQNASAAVAGGVAATPVSLVSPAAASGPSAAGDPHALLRPPATGADAPWRADLQALERQMRMEMAAARQGGAGGSGDRVTATNAMAGDPSTPGESAFLRRVQTLIDQSEVRQQQNLALRAAELSRDFDLQRRSDRVAMEQGFGRLNEMRVQDVAEQQRILNAIRVSQQQP